MSLLDLRRRLKSINSTQKITRAMEMVAASKMKKAQDAALAGRPYAEGLAKLIKNIVRSSSDIRHPYFLKREQPKKILFLFFTADRGLCGAFNSNISRYLIRREMLPEQERIVAAVGRKGMQFCKHIGENVVAEFEGMSDNPDYLKTAPITKLAVDGFLSGEFDEVILLYNHFVNTMQQEIKEKVLLPLAPLETKVNPRDLPADRQGFSGESKEKKPEVSQGDAEIEYLFEPNAEAVFEKILPRYIETIVYQSLLESNASEQSARMVAMKSASENAGELISTLTLEMNKARQASITTEILEIVGGAEALAEG
ncbi:ATP synthase F1 subunit gamma [Patescibacteria group bacterium]|nr:ATP synthase F1 subunit gamma [Patescibacteria group bacterium]